jgi:hypothetical protein
VREIKVRCRYCNNEVHRYRVITGPAVLRAVQNSRLGRSRPTRPRIRLPSLFENVRQPPELSAIAARGYKIRAVCPVTHRTFTVPLNENVKLEYLGPD